MGVRAALLLLLLPVLSAAQTSATYNIIVEENGDAAVLMALSGTGDVDVPLPLDVAAPQVSGALYVPTSNGIKVSLVGGSATVIYVTKLLTYRNDSTWTLEFRLADTDSANVVLSLPRSATVLQTSPGAQVSERGDSKNLVYAVSPALTRQVSASYEFAPAPAAQGTTWLWAALAVLMLLVIIIALAAGLGGGALLLRGRRAGGAGPRAEQRGALELTPGMKNLLRALTDNEGKIVAMLAREGGAMKRNRLERESGIAKASLASALNRLEQKNIVKVSRGYTVHLVELTDWFRSL